MPIGCSLCLSVRMPIVASIGLKCFKDDFSFIMVLGPQENRHSTFFFFLYLSVQSFLHLEGKKWLLS